jgi:hypothetical protein
VRGIVGLLVVALAIGALAILPWVLAAKRTLGWGCTMRAGGSHRSPIRANRSQVIRLRWLRRRSASRQSLLTWSRKAETASMLPGTA